MALIVSAMSEKLMPRAASPLPDAFDKIRHSGLYLLPCTKDGLAEALIGIPQMHKSRHKDGNHGDHCQNRRRDAAR